MEKQKYDVIVVGAGPAGSVAAKRIAKRGLKILLIEEHKEIGRPVHCSGWLNGCPFTEKVINEFGRDKIITKVDRWRVWTPSGEIAYEMKFNGGYFVDRIKLDQFFAQKAVEAGSKLSISTKAIDLIKDEDKILGIIAQKQGKNIKLYSDILIGCDGSYSIPYGIAKKSGILSYDKKKERPYYPGIQIEFLNIKDMEPGIIEIFFGSIFDKNLGSAFVSPLKKGRGLVGFGSFKDYLNVKNNHPVFKKRLENAQEFSVRGGLYGGLLGESLKTGAMAGLMLCGDAVGYHGITPAAISGAIAADIAVKAVNESDFSRNILKNYDVVRRKHPIARSKLGINLQNVSEENLEIILKNEGEAINKALFKDLDRFDYEF
ncbi:MAG: NAD(P)/FAD-dependent oxidoreductase [Candidatus Hodarchaeota archaeon]